MKLLDTVVNVVKTVESQRVFKIGRSTLKFKIVGKQVYVLRDGWKKVISHDKIDSNAIEVLGRLEREGFKYE